MIAGTAQALAAPLALFGAPASGCRPAPGTPPAATRNAMATNTLSSAQTQTIPDEFQATQVITIAGAHFVHDTFSAFAAPLLPVIIEKLSLSLTAAGALVVFLQAPVLLSPFIGHLADRVSLRYFVVFAPAVTAVLMSLIGLAPSYPALAALLFVTGLSVACFHAPAPAMIGRLSGTRLGTGMSIFMAAGELGRTAGPLLVVTALALWSLEGTPRLMVLGVATSAVLFWRLRGLSGWTETAARSPFRQLVPTLKRVFLPILLILAGRAFLEAALTTYLPTFLTGRGATLWLAGSALSILELAGVIGALTAGTLSDHLGRRQVLLVSLGLAPLLLWAFVQAHDWLIFPLLVALGLATLSTTPVLLAVVQEHLPTNRAAANGVFMAMAFSTRTIAVLAIGFIGDTAGLPAAFLLGAIAAFAIVPVILWLPSRTTG